MCEQGSPTLNVLWLYISTLFWQSFLPVMFSAYITFLNCIFLYMNDEKHMLLWERKGVYDNIDTIFLIVMSKL